MWNIILDGLFILNEYKWGVFIFLVSVFCLGFFQIRQLTNDKLDPEFNLLASFGIGSINLCILSYILVLFAYFWPPLLQIGSWAILLLLGYISLRLIILNKLKPIFNFQLITLGTGLLILLIMRLAFLKNIILPPYSDSPIHYQIILGLLNPDKNYNLKLSLGNIFINYYHFGFHSLTAWLALVTELDPLVIIPLLGQLFLFLAPMSVAAFTYIATNNLYSALFSGLLAAIGWMMPAFSVNWGKYPALTAISILPAVFTLPWLYQYSNGKKSIFLFYSLLALIGIVLIHSRIVICLLLGIGSYFLASKLKFKAQLGVFQAIRLSILFIFSLWPLSQLLTGFYKDTPPWIVLLILIPFAFQYYPKIIAGIFFFTFGLWFSALAPNLLKINFPPLLDRQFLEMMLYIPFSVIGGVGLGGLIKRFEKNRILKWTAIIPFMAILVLGFPQSNLFRPDSCCNYFTEDDKIAFQWIQTNKSDHTLFIISTINYDGKMSGSDAGIWIYPLAQTPINKLPFNVKWNSTKIFEEICRSGLMETFVYAGGGNFSFDKSQLTKETWAQSVFQTGKVTIYKIDKCRE